MARPPYHKLDPHLQNVLGGIKITEDDRKNTNKVFKTELDKIIAEMKKDEVFMKVFRKVNYGGSTYENLKISSANEFDLNIELQLPFSKQQLKIRNCLEIPGFVFLVVEDIDDAFTSNVSEKVRREVTKWFCNGHMLRTKVYQWMQGVLDRALNTYRDSIPVSRTTSGPALTLVFDHPDCGKFSVDLSPTFPFGLNDWPPDPVRHYSNIPFCSKLGDKNWFAVPKSPGSYQEKPELWRISFYQFEIDMMNGQEHMKAVLKLMKYLRDIQDWKQISSYYLKTIFMWVQCKEDPSFWRKGLGELFILMLQRIRQHLCDRNIPFFWNKEFNLIKKLHPDFPLKVSERIQKMEKRILANLDEKPEIVIAYFCKKIPESFENQSNVAFEKIVQEGSSGWCCIL